MLKYYLYVSDTKVDMLYAQIPQNMKSKIATEIKIDLKFLSTTFKDKEKQFEETRFSKLAFVVDYIEKYHDIGTVDYPGSFFRDTLPMRWGSIEPPPPGKDVFAGPIPDFGDIVYFGGFNDRTIIGLGGSAKHVIGASESAATAHSFSQTPDLISALKANHDDMNDAPDASDYFHALRAVSMTSLTMNGPVQQLEFLARRLLFGENEVETTPFIDEGYNLDQVLLGTPIYVAMAD